MLQSWFCAADLWVSCCSCCWDNIPIYTWVALNELSGNDRLCINPGFLKEMNTVQALKHWDSLEKCRAEPRGINVYLTWVQSYYEICTLIDIVNWRYRHNCTDLRTLWVKALLLHFFLYCYSPLASFFSENSGHIAYLPLPAVLKVCTKHNTTNPLTL